MSKRESDQELTEEDVELLEVAKALLLRKNVHAPKEVKLRAVQWARARAEKLKAELEAELAAEKEAEARAKAKPTGSGKT